MKPRYYFIFGTLLLFISMVLTVIGSVFLLSLTRFALRSHGPMGQYRLDQLLSSFPWWAPLLAIAGLVLGILLLKKYDFSYKQNFNLLAIIFILAIVLAVFVLEYFKLDDMWFRRGPMRGMMDRYIHNSQDTQWNRENRINRGREGWGQQR
jgi:hypothetical protein